ncbi:MAG: protein argonaute [Pseudothermotoga sp.]
MKLNLFEITVPPKVKRLYYCNPQTQPEIFAKNMARINNIRFVHSANLVWVELPFLETPILPEQATNYKEKTEEVIENDEELFIKTLYSFTEKLFKDNGFTTIYRNFYVATGTKKPLQSNQNVCYYESYQVKIYKINGKFYLSINPRFTFLSTNPALESEIKSIFVLNIRSGRSYPFISGEEGKLVISLDQKTQKEVAHPEWYFFNFTSKEAEKHGFSKEIYQIYSNELVSLYKKIPLQLVFLNRIINLNTAYEISPADFEKVVIFHRFANGDSDRVQDIFQLKPFKNDGSLKMTFLFPSKYKKEGIKENVRTAFALNNSVFRRSLRDLGFDKIDYLRDPETNKAVFYYKAKTFELEKKDILGSSGTTHAIVLLEEGQADLKNLLEKSPENLIILPILKSKIASDKAYVLKSFAYKILNFSQNAQPYKLLGLSPNTLYIGFDLSHDQQRRKSDYALAAVDNEGKVLYINHKRNLTLNEKLEMDLVEKDVAKSLDRYRDVHNQFPKNFFLIRDGIFFEDVNLLKNHLDLINIDYAVIEVDKNCNINSDQNLKGILARLEDDKYIYFAHGFNLQKGVEINIVFNNTKLSNGDIAKEIYLTTALFYPTPYSNLKLPYPLYITDKVALLKYEWKLYIPYFSKE